MARTLDAATCSRSRLGVWSRTLMVPSSRRNGGMRYGPSSSWERPHDSGGASRDPAESSEPESSRPTPRPQPENRLQMEEAHVGSRSADRAESPAIDRADPGGGSRDGRLSAAHASAAG